MRFGAMLQSHTIGRVKQFYILINNTENFMSYKLPILKNINMISNKDEIKGLEVLCNLSFNIRIQTVVEFPSMANEIHMILTNTKMKLALKKVF